MASSPDFIAYVLEQIRYQGELRAQKMFGDYALYADDIVFGLVCDNKLYIKPTLGGKNFIGTPKEASPFPKAKPKFLIEEQIDDSKWLSKLVAITVVDLQNPANAKNI